LTDQTAAHQPAPPTRGEPRAGAANHGGAPPVTLVDLSATQLARLLAAGEVSAREVLAAHLDRIEAVNPSLNALVTLTPERAQDAAAAADERLARGEALGPLHGLPVAHKDLVATAGIRTTLGSPLFADWAPDVDGLVVTRARAAGAITVGKTNTPEFGAGSHTFNAVFGITRNPWDPARTCGGSSGGAAVALAAGMVPLADGSDLGGSLRNPAGYCNVVGLRPSPGRVPTWPSSNPWGTMSVEGPMGRTVADVALFLSVLAGPDDRSPTSLETPGAAFGAPLSRESLAGLRIAWSDDLGGLPVDPEVRSALAPVPALLESLGARVMAAHPPLAAADEVFETLRAHQFEAGFGALYDRAANQMKPTVRWNIEAGRALSGPDVGRAEVRRGEVFGAMAAFFASVDLLATLVSQVPPFPVETEYPVEVDGVAMGSYIEWMRSCSRLTVTGCPALSIPAAFTAGGLPVGLQLVAPYRSERLLLEAAHVIEVALGLTSRRPPLP
jgi:amidase